MWWGATRVVASTMPSSLGRRGRRDVATPHQSAANPTGRADLTAGRPAPRNPSAVEHEPAQLVAQPLVVKHEIPNLERKLSTLPLALQAAGRLAVVLRRSRLGRPDRVGRRTQLVGRHLAHR